MIQNIVVAIIAGVAPALIWLLFWLQEDRKHPEPHRLLFYTFGAGMLAVFPALKLEMMVPGVTADLTTRLILWAAIEETLKLLAVAAVVLWRKEVDEPMDYPVYLITTALGFAALENALFFSSALFQPSLQCVTTALPCAFVTESVRFVGATLLHVVASAAIGIALALAFYRSRGKRRLYLAAGLILAITLHAAFNLTIMGSGTGGSLLAPSLVWVTVLCVLLLMEKVKKVHPVNAQASKEKVVRLTY